MVMEYVEGGDVATLIKVRFVFVYSVDLTYLCALLEYWPIATGFSANVFCRNGFSFGIPS